MLKGTPDITIEELRRSLVQKELVFGDGTIWDELVAFRAAARRLGYQAFGRPKDGREVVLFADTFNRIYERENLDAALQVLVEGGYRVHFPRPAGHARPLCCGRTFLSAGLVDQARRELDRLVGTYAPFAARGVPIVGLEPSCLLTLRDELLSLRSDDVAKNISAHALLLEEFLAREAEAGRLRLPLGAIPAKAVVHGHCHQKSFGAFEPVEKVLRLVPELSIETIKSSCCGMAGAFGYGADTYEASIEMAELSLLPAVRRADAATLIVADGTSCRHQIRDSAGRSALHVAQVLAMSLDRAQSNSTYLPAAAGHDPSKLQMARHVPRRSAQSRSLSCIADALCDKVGRRRPWSC